MMRHWYVVTLDVHVSVTATLGGRMCRTTWGLPFSTSRSKGRWAEETSWRSKTSFWPADLRWSEHAHFHFPPVLVMSSLHFDLCFRGSEFLYCHCVMHTTTFLSTNSKVAQPTHSWRWRWKWIRWFLFCVVVGAGAGDWGAATQSSLPEHDRGPSPSLNGPQHSLQRGGVSGRVSPAPQQGVYVWKQAGQRSSAQR